MKISKHIHSCLLVENEGITVLLDPGNYSFDEKGLNIDSLSKLDFVGITHTHPDHMYPPFIKALLKKFPKAIVVGNSAVAQTLKSDGITVETKDNEIIKLSNGKHDKVFDLDVIDNAVLMVFNRLTHPGDTINISKTTEVLAFPIQGLWTNLTLAINKIVELKPKVVVPIHDWHWKEEVRKNVYDRAEKYLKQFNIEFKKLETNEEVVV